MSYNILSDKKIKVARFFPHRQKVSSQMHSGHHINIITYNREHIALLPQVLTHKQSLSCFEKVDLQLRLI